MKTLCKEHQHIDMFIDAGILTKFEEYLLFRKQLIYLGGSPAPVTLQVITKFSDMIESLQHSENVLKIKLLQSLCEMEFRFFSHYSRRAFQPESYPWLNEYFVNVMNIQYEEILWVKYTHFYSVVYIISPGLTLFRNAITNRQCRCM